jgi:crotonobetainyl-CoA:carnitine CoA-transferase CaiB-like acyl-CoA transferase
VSAYFSSVNYNKEYRLIDYNQTNEMKGLLEEIKTCDVIIVNFKPGDADKFNLNYDDIKKINQNIIYAAITGYGENNPKPAFDVLLQAETGFMSINGTSESGPIKMPVAMIDIIAAHQLKEGILLAYIHRLKTNKGAKVSVSLYDAALSALVNQASNFLMTGHTPRPLGTLHPNIAPYGDIFTCSDQIKIITAIGTDKQFIRFCEIINIDLYQNIDFSSNPNRVKNRTTLHKLLQEKIIHLNSKKILENCVKYKVPIGKINSVAEALQMPEAKQMILEDFIENTFTQRIRGNVFNIFFE